MYPVGLCVGSWPWSLPFLKGEQEHNEISFKKRFSGAFGYSDVNEMK
jgi:hypothetical protein